MKKVMLIVLLPLATVKPLLATDRTCDGSLTDCQNVVRNAANGDTVTIAPGTFTWSGTLTISNKNIILQGAGMFDSPNPNTTITGTGHKGKFIEYITSSDTHTAILRKIEFKQDNSGGSLVNTMVQWEGTALYNPIANNGGFRMTQVRFTTVNKTANGPACPLTITDYLTGVVDHCWWDFLSKTPNAQNSETNQPSSPGYRVGSTPIPGSPPTGGWIPMFGLHSPSVPYTWGNSDFNQIYYEDNLQCRRSIGNVGDDTGSKNLRGGTKIVVRYNSMWGQIYNSHGFGESGPDAATYTAELYNNVCFNPLSTPFQAENFRTGAAVDFNNRFLGGWSNISHVLGPTFNRLTDRGNSIGPADATNYFDLNAKGTLYLDANHWPLPSSTGAVYTFNPDGGSQSSDSRVGDIYFRSNGSAPFSLNKQPWGTAGQFAGRSYTLYRVGVGINANDLLGFTIRDDSLAGDPCNGTGSPDCKGGQVLTNDRCAVITSNTAANANGDVDVILTKGHDVPGCLLGASAGMAAGDTWTLRFVKSFLGAPGGSYFNGHILNGGVIYQYSTYHLMPAWLDSQVIDGTPKFLYWANQLGDGLWTWDSKYSTDLGVHWSASTINPVGVLQGRTNGGIHSGQVKTGYPYTQTGNTVANCRIGADPNFWGSQGPGNAFGHPISYGQNFDSRQAEYNANCNNADPHCGASWHVNVPYPHPLVSGVPPVIPTPTETPTRGGDGNESGTSVKRAHPLVAHINDAPIGARPVSRGTHNDSTAAGNVGPHRHTRQGALSNFNPHIIQSSRAGHSERAGQDAKQGAGQGANHRARNGAKKKSDARPTPTPTPEESPNPTPEG